MFAWVLGPSSTGWDIWHSSRIPTEANRFQGANYYGWRHTENDLVLDQAGQEMSDARRVELMRRQQEIWVEELPAIPLWFRNTPALVHRNLQGVRPIGIPGGFTWNVHEWAWRP
jgi:peptide/nickel transport system substrate-binding protein